MSGEGIWNDDKFIVSRVDGTDVSEGTFFVLRVDHHGNMARTGRDTLAARHALHTYAEQMKGTKAGRIATERLQS